ncbi:Coiled-coil domain-containing protein 113 [Camponotus floridanus]|uniref:Cilia- and flagella-associated protein 263 n=1 Tax=Camponotus floridanus TaxID=104421 RepID=E2ASG8_CAMFO|nr:Coiled-coil domain-containing protein 113 [Camponotus floridanus]
MARQRKSTFSIGSLMLTSKQEDLCYYEDMTETELQQTLENIARSNLLLKLENDVFERYLARRDPENLQTIAQILETAKRVQKIAPQSHSHVSPVMSVSGSFMNVRDGDTESVVSIQSGSQRVTPSLLTSRTPRVGTKITYACRIEMVNTEIRELQKELIKLEQMSTKKIKYMRAQIEENEMSIRETCKTREEFEEKVIEKGIDSITGKIPAEKFIRFIEEWLKTIDSTIEQIRLKMTTIKSQIRKVKLQLQHRKELGEALRPVDFEQLNIENQVCIREIDKKNRYLLEMKKIVGRHSIALTKHKEKLNSLMSIVNDIRSKIAFKKQEIVKLQSEKVAMQVEIKKAEKQLQSVMALMDDFDVPDVIDFIKIRIELQELRKIHKQLSRQRNIQRIKFNSNR